METENIMPEIDLFPRLTKVAKAIGSLFCMHQLASHGDHFQRGGAAMLDEEIFEQQEFTWTYPDVRE